MSEGGGTNSLIASALRSDAVRSAVVSAAKDPALREAAVSAAKDPRVQQAAISAAKDPRVQAAAKDAAKDQAVRDAAISVAIGEPKGYEDDDVPGGEIKEGKLPPKPKPAPVKKVKWARYLFSIGDIPVHVHYFLPLLFLVDFLNSFRFDKWALWIVFFLVYDFILLFSVLVHELAHCLGAKLVGGHTTHILLWPLGGLAFVGHGSGPKGEVLIAIMGPLVHIPMAILWAVIGQAVYGDVHLFVLYADIWKYFGSNLCSAVASMQILLCAFNLLVPAFPLDGGRILAASLIQKFDRVRTATIMLYVSGTIGVAMVLWGLIIAQALLTAFVGVWVLYQCYLIWKARSSNSLHKYPLFTFDGNEPTLDQGHVPNSEDNDAQTSV